MLIHEKVAAQRVERLNALKLACSQLLFAEAANPGEDASDYHDALVTLMAGVLKSFQISAEQLATHRLLQGATP